MRHLPIFLLLFAATAWSVGAKTIPVPGQGASLTIPDDWTVTKRPNVVLFATAPGETAALGILVSANGDQRQADTVDFIRGMAQEITDRAKANGTAITFIDAGPKVLNGVPAGFVQSQQTYPDPDHQVIYSRTYTLAANGKFYRLSLDTRDPREDPALVVIAESFRFAPPPQVPGPNDFIVHRIGELAGIALILGALVFFFRKKIREYLGL
jgi:hypothetical protein